MDRQTQGLQTDAALLRRPTPLQQYLQHDRNADGAPEAGRSHRLQAATGHKPVLETDEFRVVEPDGTEDPWASADDGVVPERPAPEGGNGSGNDTRHSNDE